MAARRTPFRCGTTASVVYLAAAAARLGAGPHVLRTMARNRLTATEIACVAPFALDMFVPVDASGVFDAVVARTCDACHKAGHRSRHDPGAVRPLITEIAEGWRPGVPPRHGAADRRGRGRPGHNGAVIGPASGDALHVMSFNLRRGSIIPPNSWARRRPVVAELLRREQPTVLGTQEGLYGQLKDIHRDLPDHYDWIGVGRGGGSRDEFMAVFYDTSRLSPVEFDHFWLSDTPEVIGSTSWGNRNVRMVTWVRFADLRTGREFVAVNTHFDHESEDSRKRSAALLLDRVGGFDPALPVVLTGDFNAPAGGSAAYETLVTSLTDTWTAAEERSTPVYCTFHGYGTLWPEDVRIDWILTRGVNVHIAGINTFEQDGQFPSDHLPVQALITLTATQ